MSNHIAGIEANPVIVNGVEYFCAGDVGQAIGVSRQTLWRWRQGGKVPCGRRFRGRLVLFTGSEVEQIRNYAYRLEPASFGIQGQNELTEDNCHD